jgi:succinate-semialdehyde dehydrogenase/glutarate-semialdehyde dehydrogenase
MANPGLLIGGKWITEGRTAPLRDKYTGETIANIVQATRQQVTEAAKRAKAAFDAGPPSPYDRSVFLNKAAVLVGERRKDFVETYVAESGFTVADAQNEVGRCMQTLALSAEEAKRISGEVVPFHGAPGGAQRIGFTLRVPVGVVCAITPFNAPLNTVAHKVAPALAAGNPVILKPASATPLTSALLCEVLLEAGTPPDFLAIVNGPGGEIGEWLLEEQDIAFYTFTGSTEVGKAIQSRAGLRRTQMELGSIACTVVCDDADVDAALPKIVGAAFRKAGQVCTSIQRLYVQRGVYDAVAKRLVESARKAKVGDPRAEGTLTGPLISEREAIRVMSWVDEAVAQGAKLLLGGVREGPVVHPTILTDVRDDMKVMNTEIFGPVICLVPFDDFNAVMADVNSLAYGLTIGIFTKDIDRAFKAATQLRFGGIFINETCSSRVDLMPYGGTKDSGFGREGPKYAIEEMTESRLITISM